MRSESLIAASTSDRVVWLADSSRWNTLRRSPRIVAGALLLYVQPRRTPRKEKVGVGTAERTQSLDQLDDVPDELMAPEAVVEDGPVESTPEEPAAEPQSRARRRASSSRARRKRRRR